MNDDDDNIVRAWTDGSCSYHHGGEGGWSFYLEYQNKIAQRYGYIEKATCNIMELTAILRVLQFVRLTPHPLVIYTDSQYAKRCLTEWVYEWRQRGWKRSQVSSVKNKDLIETIMTHLETHLKVRKVEIKWIAGHNGQLNNERCDALARSAREQKQTNWTLGQSGVKSSNVIEQSS